MTSEQWSLIQFFKPKEFLCKCGCGAGTAEMDFHFVKCLDNSRRELGRPIVITSGFRCKEHNQKVGGSLTSSHLTGQAVDISDSKNPQIRGTLVFSLYRNGIRQLEVSRDGHIHAMLDPTKPSPFIGVEP